MDTLKCVELKIVKICTGQRLLATTRLSLAIAMILVATSRKNTRWNERKINK